MDDINSIMGCYVGGVMFGFTLTFILGGISWGFWFVVSFFRSITKHV